MSVLRKRTVRAGEDTEGITKPKSVAATLSLPGTFRMA